MGLNGPPLPPDGGSGTEATPLPRLRAGVDVAPVDGGPDGEFVCLFDRQDPRAAQVVVSRAGLLLASLLDGERSAAGVCAAFALRTGTSLAPDDLATFVQKLDEANVLDSPRHHARGRRAADEFRALPHRPAVHAGGAYPGEADVLRTYLTERFTMPGGPGALPGPVARPTPRALIAPHIDLHRGGHSYAWGYRALAEAEPADLYVLLGTSHQPMRRAFAATRLPYDTPFGPVTGDADFLARFARLAHRDIYEDELAHRREHALEFQAVYLRFLGHTGGSAAPVGAPDPNDVSRDGRRGAEVGPSGVGSAGVVSILCVPPGRVGDGGTPRDDPETEDLLLALAAAVAEDGRRICFIAGADFAHVGPQFGDPSRVDRRFAEHVRAGDLAMLDRVVAGDPDGFYRQVVREAPGPGMAGDSVAVGGPRRICGLAPMYALLRLVEGRRGVTLHYDQWIDQGGAGSVTFGCVLFE